MKKQPEIPDDKTLVPSIVLEEIRDLAGSLEVAVGLLLENGLEQSTRAALLIQPAVERLKAIAEKNEF